MNITCLAMCANPTKDPHSGWAILGIRIICVLCRIAFTQASVAPSHSAVMKFDEQNDEVLAFKPQMILKG